MLKVCEPKILEEKFVDAAKRFRIQKFQTRFGTIEWFAFDAGDISDADVRAGHSIEPFAQGNYMQVRTAITRRIKQERRAIGSAA